MDSQNTPEAGSTPRDEITLIESMYGHIGHEGIVIRRDGVVSAYVSDMLPETIYENEGLICLNPDEEDLRKRVYRRDFSKRRIFLPDELELARQEVLGNAQLVIGMTGYTDVTQEDLGMFLSAYEGAAEEALQTGLDALNDNFENPDGSDVRIGLVYGGVKRGIDGAVLQVSQFNVDGTKRVQKIPALAYNCPRYMLSLTDLEDDDPVYVANTAEEYSDRFVEGLDILFSCGGRGVSLQHDLAAATQYFKELILVDIIGMFSNASRMRDAKGRIINATQVFFRKTGLRRPYTRWDECIDYIHARTYEAVLGIFSEREGSVRTAFRATRRSHHRNRHG